MTKVITLSIIAAGLISCQDTSQPDVKPVETKIDHRSVSGSIQVTLDRDVNHIGKATLTNVLTQELYRAERRINERLSKSGLPAGIMYFEKKSKESFGLLEKAGSNKVETAMNANQQQQKDTR